MSWICIPLLILFVTSSAVYAEERSPTPEEGLPAVEGTVQLEQADEPAPATASDEAMPSPEQSATDVVPPEVPPPSVLYEGIVTRVRDVDMIEIDGERMRLLGVSGPKRWWWNEPLDCYSIESATYLENMILNKTVDYGYDRLTGPDNKRGYRRVYVYLDDMLVNADVIANGQAFVERHGDYAQKENFLELEALASLHQIGLWHTCPVECYRRHEACRVKNW